MTKSSRSEYQYQGFGAAWIYLLVDIVRCIHANSLNMVIQLIYKLRLQLGWRTPGLLSSPMNLPNLGIHPQAACIRICNRVLVLGLKADGPSPPQL